MPPTECSFVCLLFFSLKKKSTHPYSWTQLSEMNKSSSKCVALAACLMHWAHSTPLSSGPKTFVTRQFQHIPFLPHVPAATHNSIGQNICKNYQADECYYWREQQLGTLRNCEVKKKCFTTTHPQLQGNLTANSVHIGRGMREHLNLYSRVLQ